MGRRVAGAIGALLAVLLVSAGVLLGDAILKLDVRRFGSRDAWQRPDDVVRALALGPGLQIADVGAGGGYFTFRLAEAVGPSGRVYAVDVDPQAVRDLAARAAPNVVATLATSDDPRLPRGGIDVALFCDAYHHIDRPVAYFERLRASLRPGGRVVILELRPRLLMSLTGHEAHATAPSTIHSEMRAAGYVLEEELGFLPLQSFLVFTPDILDPRERDQPPGR